MKKQWETICGKGYERSNANGDPDILVSHCWGPSQSHEAFSSNWACADVQLAILLQDCYEDRRIRNTQICVAEKREASVKYMNATEMKWI